MLLWTLHAYLQAEICFCFSWVRKIMSLGGRVILCKCFEKLPNCFQSGYSILHSHHWWEIFHSPYLLSTFIICLIYYSHSSTGGILSDHGLNLHFIYLLCWCFYSYLLSYYLIRWFFFLLFLLNCKKALCKFWIWVL